LFILNHLTGFSRSVARHGFRRGPVDHKKAITQSTVREKPACRIEDTRLRPMVARNSPSAALQTLPDTKVSRYGLRLAE